MRCKSRAVYIFWKTDFFEKKTQTEVNFGPQPYTLSTDTQTHTSTEMLTDKNGTKAQCATDFIVDPRQCACKIFEHVIA